MSHSTLRLRSPAATGLPALGDLPGVALAALSFVVVLSVGAGLVARRAATVERAVDRTAAASPAVVVYGLVAFGLAAAVGGYGLLQVARIGVVPAAVRGLGSLVVAATLAGLGAFGFLVLGSYLTELEGTRRPRLGAVVGAVASALPWLVLAPPPALAVWVVVSAAGLGAPTRQYIHADRAVGSGS